MPTINEYVSFSGDNNLRFTRKYFLEEKYENYGLFSKNAIRKTRVWIGYLLNYLTITQVWTSKSTTVIISHTF